MEKFDSLKCPVNRTDLILGVISELSADTLATRSEVFSRVRTMVEGDDRFPYPVYGAIAESLAYLATNDLIVTKQSSKQPLGGWRLTTRGFQRKEYTTTVSS